MLFSISKQSFPTLPGQLMSMTGVISGAVTPKDKTKSNPLAREKVRILSKSVVSIVVKGRITVEGDNDAKKEIKK